MSTFDIWMDEALNCDAFVDWTLISPVWMMYILYVYTIRIYYTYSKT